MMPLPIAGEGRELNVRKVSGSPEIRAHLENLGFVPESLVRIISTINGNLIVDVKGARIAISREMAMKIQVE